VNGKRILMVLGGTHHDFDGFARWMTPVFEAAGHRIEATYDLDALIQLEQGAYDVVVLHTCLATPTEERPEPVVHSQAQIEGLTAWVRAGSGLLASHAATTSAQASPALRALMGGVFVKHPPQFSFTVYPVYREHPVTAGIEAFAVHDEFYMQLHEPDVDVHVVALDRGVAYPLVWTRREGQGRVAHVALGHSEKVWSLQPYQRLMLQAIDWLGGSEYEVNR
jgi:type 1 glutamine amidotransferase